MRRSWLTIPSLGVFGNLSFFSQDKDGVGYEDEETYDSLFSITIHYENLIQKAALKQLHIISQELSGETLSKAGTIDLLILIRLYFSSMLYFYVNVDFTLFTVLQIVANFPLPSLSAFSKYIIEGRFLDSTAYFLHFLSKQVRAVKPFELARFFVSVYVISYSLDHLKIASDAFFNNEVNVPLIVRLIYTFLDNPETLDKHRLYFTVFESLPIIPSISAQASFPDIFYELGAYDLCLRAEELFPGILFRLTQRSPLDISFELKTSILKSPIFTIPNLDSKGKTISLLYGFGMVKALALFPDSEVEPNMATKIEILGKAIFGQRNEILDYALEKYSQIFGSAEPQKRLELFRIAAIYAPKAVVESLLWQFPQLDEELLKTVAVSGRNFLNFDLLYKNSNELLLSESFRTSLILASMDSLLPESKIREYIDKFGLDLVGKADLKPRFLESASFNGYLPIIRDFNLCDIDKESKFKVLLAASKSQETEIVKYIIDSFEPAMEFADFSLLSTILIEFKNPDVLKYLLEMHLCRERNPNDPKLKPRTILALITYCSWVLDKPDDEIKGLIVEFCYLLGWTKSHIEVLHLNESTPDQSYEIIKQLFTDWRLKDSRIRTICLNFWKDYVKIMNECLELLPQC